MSKKRKTLNYSEERHVSVLLQPVLELFEGLDMKVFVDGTLGAGGHSAAILAAHPELERLLGIDQDPIAREIAAERLDGRATICEGNFERLEEFLDGEGVEQIDGMLLDLGVSSMQLDMPEKGFSFSNDAPLDMRMDPTQELTAREVVNTWEEEELAILFRDYGETPSWRRAAKRIVQERAERKIETTGELVEVLTGVVRAPRGKKIHPMTLVFQALRLAVNDELHVLERVLPLAIKRLRAGGRLAVITFHSLEDRIVKNLFKGAAADFEPDPTNPMTGRKDKVREVQILTRKPTRPTPEEQKRNPRSRSAKLRAVEKLEVPS